MMRSVHVLKGGYMRWHDFTFAACLILSALIGVAGLSSCGGGGGGGGSQDRPDEIMILPPGNRAPLASQSFEDVTVPLLGSVTIADLGSYFSDPDGDRLSYTAISSDQNVAGVLITDPGPMLVLQAPGVGSATVTVTVTDPSGLATEQSFTVTVILPPGNRAPLASQSFQDVTVPLLGSVTIADLGSYFSDPDGDRLSYTAISSDQNVAGVLITDPGPMLVLQAPGVGSATVTVTATDPSGLATEQSFTVTVVDNNGPSPGSPEENRAPEPVGSLSTQVVLEGDTLTLDMRPYFLDPDGDALTYTVMDNTIPPPVTLSISRDGTLVIEGVSVGYTSVIVTAADLNGLSATQRFLVEVQPSNYPPERTASFDELILSEGDTHMGDASSSFSDPDGDPLTYTAHSSDINVATASISPRGAFTVRAVSRGRVTVTLIATDPGGLFVDSEFFVTVRIPEENTFGCEYDDVIADLSTPNERDADGDAPLHNAALFGRPVECINALLAAGADPDARDSRGRTPLHVVTGNYSPDVAVATVQALASAGADPNIKDNNGDAPLHDAALYGRPVAYINALLAAGADPDARDSRGRTPLHVVTGNYSPDVAVATVQALASAGADPNIKDNNGDAPLHDAALYGRPVAYINALLAAGADPDARDSRGRTPLHVVTGNYSPDVAVATVQALASAGADPNIKDNNGDAPLHDAALYGRPVAYINALLAAGADPDARDSRGRTPLHVVTGNYSPDVAVATVQALASAGADPNIKDNNGDAPLHDAALYGRPVAYINALLAAGADPDARDSRGRTPLHVVTGNYSPDVAVATVQALASAGADPNIKDNNGDAPLHDAALYGRPVAYINALLAAGADPDARDSRGRTPLHVVTDNYSPDVAVATVQALASAGADPNIKDNNGHTPLYYAYFYDRPVAYINALLAAGADPNALE